MLSRDSGAGSPMPYTTSYQPDRGHFESEERFRQIVEGLHHIVALTDYGCTEIFFVNAAYERIWGQPREKLYREPMSFLEGVHPQDRERVQRAIFGDPNREFDLEFRVVRPDNEQRWVWSRGFPVRNARGDIYRVVSITEDVTERKAIAESHERLLRGFTHDVKNPLGAADGYLSLMELGVFGEMSAPQLEAVGRTRKTIRTALNLVSQLLDIERAKAGQLLIQRGRVDLGAITRECVEDFRSAADAKRLSLTLKLPDEDDLVVESDRTRVRQILANLLSNAVKYTQPDGNITIAARVVVADDTPCPVSCVDDKPCPVSCVALAVADDGPGIPPEKHRLLFREFTRFDPSAAEGSGIGLAISQHIAQALGAAITFTSAPGVGSEFTLWLPRKP